MKIESCKREIRRMIRSSEDFLKQAVRARDREAAAYWRGRIAGLLLSETYLRKVPI
jgi:hypothetical protein